MLLPMLLFAAAAAVPEIPVQAKADLWKLRAISQATQAEFHKSLSSKQKALLEAVEKTEKEIQAHEGELKKLCGESELVELGTDPACKAKP